MDDDVAIPFHRGLLVQPNCEGCPLQGSVIVPPEGNPRASVAIVGENPGHNETQQGRPFVGLSGKLLNRLILEAGGAREEFWITNAVLCQKKTVQIGEKILNPEQVLKLAAVHCRPRLFAELRIVRPKAIVALGTQALKSTCDPSMTMKGRRGGIHQIDLGVQLNKSLEGLGSGSQ